MIGVSLVSYRAVDEEMLRRAVDGLSAQRQQLAVAVWTNADPKGCTATTYRRVLESVNFICRIHVVSRADNVGYTGGHNRNLRHLFEQGCTEVLVLNNDLVLAPEALDALSGAAQAQSGRVLVGPLLTLGDRETMVSLDVVDTAGIRWTRTGRHLDTRQGETLPIEPGQCYRTEAVSGACILVPRDAFEHTVRVTGEFFDECFLAYREDAELGLRARRIGIHSIIEPRARGLHFRGTPGTQRGNALIDLLSVQNRFLLRAKYLMNGPWSSISVLLRDLVVVGGVLARERSSITGLTTAWRIRRRMRWKGRRLDAH